MIASSAEHSSRIQWHKFSSSLLKSAPLLKTPVRELAVYLPPDYSDQKKYPVFYILSAWGNRPTKYLADDSVFGESLPTQFDRMIESKSLEPVILVFPDGSTPLGCSQYIDSSSSGMHLTHLCDEIVPFIDQTYSTLAFNSSRAALGHSSGGFGALHLGFRRPDVFSYVCSAAGDSFFELNLLPALLPTLQELDKAGSLDKFLEEFLNHPNPGSMGSSKIMAMMLLSLAPCYAPRPGKPPLYGELFFDPTTGKINPQVWQEYLNWDPLTATELFSENIKSLKLILLDAGKSDEFGAQYGHRQLFSELKKLGAQVEITEFSGRHSGHNHRFVERVQRIQFEMQKIN